MFLIKIILVNFKSFKELKIISVNDRNIKKIILTPSFLYSKLTK